MNIIIVNDYAYINGGAGQIAFQTAKLLNKEGHHVIFFSAVGPVDENLSKSGIEVVCLGQYDILNDPNRVRAAILGLWNFRAGVEMKKVLSNFSPDNTIIHIHGLSKSLTTSIVRVAHSMGFKILYHLHDYGIACPNLGFFNYREQQICHRRAMGFDCVFTNCDSRSYAQKMWRLLRQIIQKNIGGVPKYIDGFIYISQFSLNMLKEYIPKQSRLYYLRNPLEVEKTHPIEVRNNKAFIFVGRLSKEKNPALLAKAARDLDVPVIFVGDGEERNHIKTIYPKAEIVGWVHHQKIYKYMNRARTLVFPSLLGETQGLTAFEAQAYGVPVIVSDECAAREAIIPGKTGWTFHNNSLKDLKKHMTMALDDHTIEIMGRESFHSFWDNGNSKNEEYIHKLKDIYIETLISKG